MQVTTSATALPWRYLIAIAVAIGNLQIGNLADRALDCFLALDWSGWIKCTVASILRRRSSDLSGFDRAAQL
jgi:hypothetical protein